MYRKVERKDFLKKVFNYNLKKKTYQIVVEKRGLYDVLGFF